MTLYTSINAQVALLKSSRKSLIEQEKIDACALSRQEKKQSLSRQNLQCSLTGESSTVVSQSKYFKEKKIVGPSLEPKSLLDLWQSN
jgi:hypothetical protein